MNMSMEKKAMLNMCTYAHDVHSGYKIDAPNAYRSLATGTEAPSL